MSSKDKKSDAASSSDAWQKLKSGMKRQFDLDSAEGAKKIATRAIALAAKFEVPVTITYGGSTSVTLNVGKKTGDTADTASMFIRRLEKSTSK